MLDTNYGSKWFYDWNKFDTTVWLNTRRSKYTRIIKNAVECCVDDLKAIFKCPQKTPNPKTKRFKRDITSMDDEAYYVMKNLYLLKR